MLQGDRPKNILNFVSVLLIGFVLVSAKPWGFYAHRKINEQAVFCLPQPLHDFCRENVQYLSEHAIDPDKRRHSVKNEPEKHYIDLDHYSSDINFLKDSMPKSWKDAVSQFSEDSLREYGIAPWNAIKYYYKLVDSFKSKQKHRILKTMADFGHYIGDIHVPLHSTKNYNGQLTGQDGIHGFWESRLPELFFQDYNMLFPDVVYVEDLESYIWDIVLESHRLMPMVLEEERALRSQEALGKTYEKRGVTTVYTYSKSFAQKYHENLNGMVENRLRDSVFHLACLWYSAWVDAGQPDLSER